MNLIGGSMGKYLTALFVTVLLMAGKPGVAQESGKPFVIIGTGGVSGVYYAAGHAVAKVFSRVGGAEDFRLDAESSQGSVDNINRVLAGEWSFGIAQADDLYNALRGEGLWKGTAHSNLRAVARLHSEAMTIVVNADRGINSIGDLKGKTVIMGEPGSSDEQDACDILRIYGIDPATDLLPSSAAAVDAPELLQKGVIDAYFYTVGHPNVSLHEATFGDRKVKLLAVDDEAADLDIEKNPHRVKTEIPIDFYERLENREPVATIGVKAVLFTRDDTPGYQVSAILRALLDDFPRFKRQHPAFVNLSRNNLPNGILVPLHPAAYAVYREKGILK